ncbi:amino acid carrier protein [Neocallimastix lanati (nom. inval.)]|jgi:AGCS family alanine or glycine:cation symporter|uniref:Amino acid carrier protein n=1 Tax=Neocallimastix californiae TaxID=1754190 RepID=A0A1Y2APC8_9FUNG|nr:amino acid carrier protein [Neocallimastix sp. JGI-2020a]ORY24346.1 amino acid carrier protein [Neocallimastix californiae]|eukprot:ORY24346.1 amino acid carrier protein [Neocallimastix californiae]
MLDEVLNKIDDVVWGIPTIVLILITGIILTIRSRGIQFTKLLLAVRLIFKKNDAEGELSGFSALCTALSATIGTGNIVGVATAIVAGGPGALFWMWIAAIFGTATKFSECMLAIKYRDIKEDGHVLGGPFLTIEKGMGKRWKWLSFLFSIFGVMAGLLGIGTMSQINGITSAIDMAFSEQKMNVAFSIGEKSYTWATVIGGIIVTVLAALVILGGLKRISKVAQSVVPTMAIIYVLLGIAVLVINIVHIPHAFLSIFKSAFGYKAIQGGAVGWTVKQVTESMQKGIARGIFSNEAGLGSAPIAAASVQTEEPVEQGLVNMTGTVIDTLIVCTITGLAIVIALDDPKFEIGDLTGAKLTSTAFSFVLGIDNSAIKFIIMVCLAFFAFTTILGWDYYSEKCLEYITNGRMKLVFIYRLIYIVFIAIGPYFTVDAVFTIADITNGLMAIPNCISLIVLSGVMANEVKTYFATIKN